MVDTRVNPAGKTRNLENTSSKRNIFKIFRALGTVVFCVSTNISEVVVNTKKHVKHIRDHFPL